MTGTYIPVGVPVNIGGRWYQPTAVMSLTSASYIANPTSSMPGVPFTPADILPVSLPTAALSVMVSQGSATQVG